MLTNGPLSVVPHNSACTLTLTQVVTASGTLSLSTPIALGESYGTSERVNDFEKVGRGV
jgi:hypothetical protein